MSAINVMEAGRFLNYLKAESVQIVTVPVAGEIVNPVISVPHIDLYTDEKVYYDFNSIPEIDLEKVKKSSLRFTWELMQPDYYRGNMYSGLQIPLVIIASTPVNELPAIMAEKHPEVQLLKQFNKTSGIYRYQTFVSVFAPP